MKHLQPLMKKQPEPIGISREAAPESTSGVLKNSNQTHAGWNALSKNQTVADRIRNYCLHILIFILTCHAVFGEIKNGYEKNILGSKESLKIQRAKLLEDQNITPAQRRKIQSTIITLVNHVSYYDLTESLLIQFKMIAPELYTEVNTICDRLGRSVNVYIKFVPADGTDVKAEGTTYMDQSDSDIDAPQSEYGLFTVSVKVWIVPKALFIVAHELGHVKYQVPNLASYYVFYKERYNKTSTVNSIGHDTNDPSGLRAFQCEKSFKKNYVDFIKVSIVKVQNPLVLLARLRKNWSKNTAFV